MLLLTRRKNQNNNHLKGREGRPGQGGKRAPSEGYEMVPPSFGSEGLGTKGEAGWCSRRLGALGKKRSALS